MAFLNKLAVEAHQDAVTARLVFHAKNGWERNEVKNSFLKLKFGPSAWPARTSSR